LSSQEESKTSTFSDSSSSGLPTPKANVGRERKRNVINFPSREIRPSQFIKPDEGIEVERRKSKYASMQSDHGNSLSYSSFNKMKIVNIFISFRNSF